MGWLSRRYEQEVPKHLRVLGEANGAPKPNRFLRSAEGGRTLSEDDLSAADETMGGESLPPDADVIPEDALKVIADRHPGPRGNGAEDAPASA